jgi:hypothetical protein
MNAELPRCLTCAYVLEGLQSARCPECGRAFDPSDPSSFTLKPPFLFWRFWLPGLIQSAFLGAVILGGLLLAGSTGWAMTIAAPVTIGSLVAYKCRVRSIFVFLLSACGLCGVVVMLFSASLSGLLCSVVALVVLGIPTMMGALLGMALRNKLKNSGFDQRHYFPVIVLVLFPPGVAAAEAVFGAEFAPEIVRTSRVLPVGIERAWGRMAFYEDLPQRKPWLLEWAGPVPVRTDTKSDSSGVTRTCVYERGYLRKQVTEVRAPALMRFVVTEQHVGEEHSVQLIDGSFAFAAAGPDSTRVTLETRYRPKLSPRWCWRPFERLVNRQVHEHVLAGMAAASTDPSDLSRAIAEARR